MGHCSQVHVFLSKVYLFFCPQWKCLFCDCVGSLLLHGLSLVAVSGGYSAVAVPWLLVAVASLVVEVLEQLWHMESVIVPHGPICLTACGIFLDQGSNPGLILHWQVASSPLGHEGSPVVLLSII